MMRILFALLLTVCVGAPLLGKELNCTCTINSTQITTSDRGIFRDMKSAIEQFMNSRKWSGDAYKSHEKIKCNLLMTITKMPSIGNFTASAQIRHLIVIEILHYPISASVVT